MNGIDRDHYAVKRKNIIKFIQKDRWELPVWKPINFVDLTNPAWFHFKKNIVFKDQRIVQNDDISQSDIIYLNETEQRLYKQKIDPYFPKTSPYKGLKLKE